MNQCNVTSPHSAARRGSEVPCLCLSYGRHQHPTQRGTARGRHRSHSPIQHPAALTRPRRLPQLGTQPRWADDTKDHVPLPGNSTRSLQIAVLWRLFSLAGRSTWHISQPPRATETVRPTTWISSAARAYLSYSRLTDLSTTLATRSGLHARCALRRVLCRRRSGR